MTKFITKDRSERGALMIEAIALLGLMTMMSPMIVRQTADRTAEMEEVAIAGQVKAIKDALQNYIEANYQSKAKTLADGAKTDDAITVTATDLAPYLPATYLSGTDFKGNKLVDGFDVGIRAQCAEARNATTGIACGGAPVNGVITSGIDAATCRCSRYKMTGMVVSKSDSNQEIDDRRASRIAQMLGADGGYMRTMTMVNSVSNNAAIDIKKVLGSQGMWEADDVGKYIPTLVNTNAGGKIAAATIYSSGLSGDYLYRKKVDGLPDANSMFTDLDMGGNGNCVSGANTGGCNRIDNAGGLEVVGGRILIRQRNGTEGNNQAVGTGNEYARIALGTDNSHMDVTGNLALKGGGQLDIASGGATYMHAGGQLDLHTNSSATLNARQELYLHGGNEVRLESFGSTVDVVGEQGVGIASYGGSVSTYSAGATTLTSASLMNLRAASSMSLNAASMSLNSNTSLNINSSTTQMTSNTAILMDVPSGRTTFGMNSGGATMGYQNNMAAVSVGTLGGHLTASMNASQSSFQLQPTKALLNVNGKTFFNLALTTAGSNTGLYLQSDSTNGGLIEVRNSTGASSTIKLEGNTGIIRAGVMQPETIRLGNNTYGSPIQNRQRVNFSDLGTAVSAPAVTATDASVSIDTSGTTTPYSTHSSDSTKYNRFRVDPAFISVMNDIKITSRGGARLSEALPNYITKGIYELTNSYRAGPWPCTANSPGNCRFRVPYKSPQELGMSVGGWEHNCSGTHPAFGCDASTSGSGFITVSYYNATYATCPANRWCWAHPFLGVVPAPGRSVSTSDLGGGAVETMSAYDEGVCPDGYQAVMTLTPTTFELGKVSYVNTAVVAGNVTVAYNPGWSDYSNDNNVRGTGIYQPATKLGIYVKEIKDSSKLRGWAVAMGTVTWTDTTDDYIWNMGGVDTDSWSAYAHTYCYFNPSRFTMPNMVRMNPDSGATTTATSGALIINPMDNPGGTNN